MKFFVSYIVPLLLFCLIVIVTVFSSTQLYKNVPKIAICIYDSTFKQAINPTVIANKKDSSKPELSFPNNENIYSKTGPIGDTFGGTIGPVIALFAAFLTFLAFFIQYRANVQQRNDIDLERFENNFYEMLRLHMNNVNDMNIADIVKGRKAFVRMFYEFQYCYTICESFYNSLLNDEQKKKINITRFSYKVFFYGIGKESEKQLYLSEDEKNLFSHVKPFLTKLQENFVKNTKVSLPIKLSELKGSNPLTLEDCYYYPFDGHVSGLGHYYRHLYQTVRYVVDQKKLNETQKLNYLRTLRAQLSNHEQLLLYYNAITDFGGNWLTNGYFTRYRMIHNLPLPLADFGIKPKDNSIIIEGMKYWEKKGQSLFEWDE